MLHLFLIFIFISCHCFSMEKQDPLKDPKFKELVLLMQKIPKGPIPKTTSVEEFISLGTNIEKLFNQYLDIGDIIYTEKFLQDHPRYKLYALKIGHDFIELAERLGPIGITSIATISGKTNVEIAARGAALDKKIKKLSLEIEQEFINAVLKPKKDKILEKLIELNLNAD